jgi:uncharacterized protein with HEPN domain
LPFKDANTSLRDIAIAIGSVGQITAGMDFNAFREDPNWKLAAASNTILSVAGYLENPPR